MQVLLWLLSVHHVPAFAVGAPITNAATAANRYFFISGPFCFDDEAFEGEPSLSSVTDVAPVKAQNLLSSAKNPAPRGQSDDWRRGGLDRMIRIAITQAAFEAIAATLPLGSTGFENTVNEKGERMFARPPFDRRGWLAGSCTRRDSSAAGVRLRHSDMMMMRNSAPALERLTPRAHPPERELD
jgi:hypothetical protein